MEYEGAATYNFKNNLEVQKYNSHTPKIYKNINTILCYDNNKFNKNVLNIKFIKLNYAELIKIRVCFHFSRNVLDRYYAL